MAGEGNDSGACADCWSKPKTGPGGAALFVVRAALGLLFIISGGIKLGFIPGWGDPQGFAGGILAFRILHSDVIPFMAYAIPWTEVICGAGLLLGLASRGAGLVTAAMLAGFIAGMVSVLYRKLDVDCSCFGGQLGEKLPNGMKWIAQVLDAKVGVTSIVRNAVLIAMGMAVVAWGPGMLALGRAFRCGRCCERP